MKKTLALTIATLCSLLPCSTASAAAPALIRSLTYNSPANLDDRAFGVAVDRSDGSFVVVGYTDRSDVSESHNVLVRKYDASGNLLWTQTYDAGGLMQQGRAVAIDGSNNVVVAGLQVTLTGGLDALLIKYDANGTQQWVRTFGGGGDDQGYAVAVDTNDNSIVMAGRYNLSDWFVAKYDSAGTLQWSQSYNHLGGFDIPSAVTISPASTIFVAGDDENFPFGVNYDLIVKRYDAAGTELSPVPFIRFNAANDGESARAVALDPSGNVYVGGSGHDPAHPGANWDWLVLKYDSTGVPLWTNYYSGPSSDGVASLAVDACGNVVAAGFESVSGQLDWRVHKYGASGNLLWSLSYAGTNNTDDEAAGVALTPNGHVLVAGYETVPGQGMNVLIREYASDLQISCSGNVTNAATNALGTAVTYSAPIVTDSCGIAGVACSPASGSVFPVGDTTVTCTATNDGGYIATCAFTVHVSGASEQLDSLLTTVATMSLPSGIKSALTSKLQDAIADIAMGNTAGACAELKSFISQVTAQKGKKISNTQANTLITAANQIRAVLNCP